MRVGVVDLIIRVVLPSLRRGAVLGALGLASIWSGKAYAQSPSLVNVCSGLSVQIPVLQPVANVATGLLAGLLEPVLNGVVGNVNVNLTNALSGKNLGVSAVDQNGNLVTAPSACNLSANSLSVAGPGGISIGSGVINGLGPTSASPASAADVNAIAFGAGATTGIGASSAIAIGLRGTVSAVDGVAIGRDAVVSSAGGIAFGAGSSATRPGMNGAPEAFTGVGIASGAGALSVGSAAAPRQIVNVAGGTQATDAVNLRQLRAVGDGLAGALGGQAGFDAATGLFTGPQYTIRGGLYSDVGSALAALDTYVGQPVDMALAADNSGALGAPTASGTNALAAGYGASAGGAGGTALGSSAQAAGDNAVAVGSGSIADAAQATAIGAGAVATHIGSTALGSGAVTSRANQMALGSASSAYTMPGLTSAQSRAAQSGPTQFVTTDAAGNLAATTFDPAALGGDLSLLGSRMDSLAAFGAAARREARQGIAAAMSMAAAPMPSAAGRTAWALNSATFKGEWAGGISIAHRLDIAMPLAVTAGVSTSSGRTTGLRVGMSGEF